MAGHRRRRSPFEVTILFVPASSGPEQLAASWADDCDQIIIRLCPICKRDSIVGHGHRRKQAHDEHHDWIGIRRGRCIKCGRTFTFLPVFSLPYTHYSLVARCRALLRRFVEHCSWERAASKFKDAENYRKQHHIQNAGLDFFIDLQPSESIPESDLVPTNKLIGFGDVAAAARITSTLASLGKNYDLRYGNDITITDLQSSPAILIGGFSNAWTMQITRRLRYTLEQADKVVDNNDKSKVWQRKEDEANEQQDDYAVLSRLIRSETGSFVLSIAGIASSGNQAAADFISDPRRIDKLLQNAPPGWQNMNMQVVLHTTTINDIPTSVDVQAIYFW